MKHFFFANNCPGRLRFISRPQAKEPLKRLFIGLAAGTSLLLCLFLLAGWIVSFIGLGNIHPLAPLFSGVLLIACILLVAGATLGLILQILSGWHFWGALQVRGLTIKFFLPIMELLARSGGFSPGEVRRSFIKVNNELTQRQNNEVEPKKILILLPHCLQRVECSLRLSYHVDACARCGCCPIAGMLTLRDTYATGLAVATGGTIARRIVVETKPALIIAVACERDLASGIQDAHPFPVYGILNHRPEGPCRNTQVALHLVEDALRRFCKKSRLPEIPLFTNLAQGCEKTSGGALPFQTSPARRETPLPGFSAGSSEAKQKQPGLKLE